MFDANISHVYFFHEGAKMLESRRIPAATELTDWLTRRFRKGLRKFLATSKKLRTSPNNDGPISDHLISKEIFANTLSCLHLPELCPADVIRFFARFGLKPTSNGGLLPFHELLRHFQDRSQAGVAHHLFTINYLPRTLQEGQTAPK